MMRTTEERLIPPACQTARPSTRRIACALGVMTLTLAGCAKERTAADSSVAAASSAPAAETGGMGDMKGMAMEGKGGASGMRGMKGMGGDSGGMAGMQGMSGMMGMMGDMQKQMDGMMKVGPEQMKAMMPAHRQMVANMLGEMTAEMRRTCTEFCV